MGQPAYAMAVEDAPLLEEAEYRPAAGPTRAAQNYTAALSLRDRGFYNPPQHLRRRAQAEGALEWLVNFVALIEPEVLPELGLPAQWVEFMLSQHDDLQLEAQRMVYLAQLATPERLGSLARARAAAMLYDAVTPEDWYYASRALAKLPAWVLMGEDQTSLLAEEGEKRQTASQVQGSSREVQGGEKNGAEPQYNRAQRRRFEKLLKK